MGSTPVIALNDVRKIYPLLSGDVHALDGVSLEITKGEFVAIMGPSGSGKSTLMNQIGCLDVPTTGTVSIEGQDIGTLSDYDLTALRRDSIGYIFQKFNLIPLLTAYENVEYPMLLRYRKYDDTGRVQTLLDRVGINAALAAHRPSELSGGQQQRVAIARALINEPAILLCDEPTGNLDSKTSTQIMEMLADLNREGRTVIMVTHDESTAEYADRTIRIQDGRIA
ncbi:ABC transporter ATP-binding protein [Methanogenium organophilum]|uniref:ABC transporter ATP-binding protein n=1 Tax=Methanogenium organophilum TaxID=2199 RepID=A0A9X9S4G6_METOG|nr:ABC transporter ATP-binding protein [Methanogenium organophilum]WAI01774.1 ABC transporter ATP-binding protein [Methanogenium organophilum]